MRVPYQFYKEVIENSNAQLWAEATQEWRITACVESYSGWLDCACGHHKQHYGYTLLNKKTGKRLHPICSACVVNFGSDTLTRDLRNFQRLEKLVQGVESKQFIDFTEDWFSRPFLKWLFNHGAFKATQYNDYNELNDLEFLLSVFKRSDISEKAKSKVKALISQSIIPFAIEQIKLVD